jgi:pilus assembly protein FimV
MRSLARWGTLSLLAAPLGAWALSLGEIEIRSALNQPFAAEIALSGTTEELQSLRVTLASPETFARYGLDRPAVLGTFAFRVGANAAGRSVVTVTSSQSIGEPFIELLVEASSRSGRFLHQYTVFLDPPTFLPETAAPAAIQAPQTREPEPSVAGGAIPRTPPQPTVQPAAPPAEVLAPAPARGPAPNVGAGGSYGPVQNGETLWGIASQMRSDGLTMNQMMVAIFEANPQAFDANMNILRRGTILRIPERAELGRVDARAATAAVQQHSDTWQGRAAQAPRLVLVPPSSEDVTGSPGARTPAATAPAADDAEVTELRDEVVALQTELEESRRLLELRNEELSALQDQLSADPDAVANAEPEGALSDPGNDLESEPLFADEEVPIAIDEPAVDEPTETETAVEADAPAPIATPAPRPSAVTTTPEPSLVERVLGWIATPIVWIVVGAVVVLLGLLLFLRRRRTDVEDVTGQWEALEAEVDGDAREATARMRRQARDEDFLVHEQRADADEPEEVQPKTAAPAPPPARGRPRAATPEARTRQAESEAVEATLSSQTVINLDQADPIAEADFHMAYGLYDQAADLVSKALKAKPDSRELKLKLLEVFFVWGNKDSFLKAAQGLRKEMGGRPDGDWDKVIIMGKQICPDEALFASATAAAGEVDVDLEAGEAPALDLAFDAEEGAGGEVDLDLGLGGSEVDLDFATGERTAIRPKKKPAEDDDFALDIGERTQAGLEEALAELDQQASATTPDLDIDSLAATQESPTIETPRKAKDDEWGVITMESPTVEASGPGTATVQRPSFDDDDDLATVETPTIESTFGRMRGQASEGEGTSASGEYTAELNLDDLGLDVADIEGLPHDLGDLPSSEEAESDTREQPRVGVDSDLLSATGVTQVLEDTDLEHLNTAVLSDDDATLMAPGFEGDRLSSTEVLEHSGEEGGDEDALDLNLDDFSAALRGSDTVEQPRTASFERGVFAGGETPIDIDIGADVRGDDEPTGTEEVSPIDPQTMTEVGTKLDLARAYIDMGDPEGARSILEEVLDEGDAGQRREAQSLINALPA